MHARPATGTMARATALGALLALGACGHVRWPGHHAPPPPPAPVHELEIAGAASPAQYWKRNTLLLDMSAVSGAGRIVLAPAAGNSWPARLAVRVRPGAFGALEVRGAVREVLPIGAAGVSPVDLELPPGICNASTAQITVSWGPVEAPQP